MKQYLIVLSLLLTLGLVNVDARPKHRHHQPTTVVSKPQTPVVSDSATVNDEVVAYSDTTVVAPSDFDETDASDDDISIDPDDYDDPFSWLSAISKQNRENIWAIVVIIVVCLIFAFLFLLLPVIIVIMLLRYLIKRHNRNVDFREQRMADMGNASGPPPAPGMETNEVAARNAENDMWQRGVRNTSIGVGLMALFWIMGAHGLVGIGILVACLGVGQMIIARTSRKKD